MKEAMLDAVESQSEELRTLLKNANNTSGMYDKLFSLIQQSQKTPVLPETVGFSEVIKTTEQMVLQADFDTRVIAFLESLRYKEMPRRKEKIASSFQNTYSWILTLEEDKRKEAKRGMSEPERILAALAEERMSDEEKSQRRQNDLKKDAFVHWLTSSDDIFWITGKAGSGKSTLIKLIDDDPRTKEGLNQWIDNRCVRDEGWWIQSGLVRGCCVAHDELLDKSVRNGAESLEALATLRARKLSEDLKGMLNSIKRILPESSGGQLQIETNDNHVENLQQLKDSTQHELDDTRGGAEASHKTSTAGVEDWKFAPTKLQKPRLNLVTASFYFWNAGTHMQKSQQGLLQSLLFQIISACPGLAAELCPERWSSQKANSTSSAWTVDELYRVICAAMERSVHDTWFCFFIDGLDEYAGEDPYALLSLINSLRTCRAAKFCVSSRPWNVFMKEYGSKGVRTLMLNNYTREDMTIYIDGKLKKDPRFLKLAKQDARIHNLALEVSRRANGVFFWVYLVVQDLLRGMNDGDDITTLQRRLEALPTDLEEYFQHMLDRLDHIYQERTAQTLMVAVTALNPVSAMAVYCIEHDRSLASFIRLAQIQAIDPDQYQYISAEARTLINKWCRDLCYVSDDEPFGNIEFLHRTVKEFLNNETIYRILEQRCGKNFDMRGILSRTHLAQLHCAVCGRSDVFNSLTNKEVTGLARTVLLYAKEKELCDNSSSIAELEELSRLCTALGALPDHQSFIAWAVSCHLHGYVNSVLEKDPELLFCGRQHRTLVDYAYENELSDFDITSEDPDHMVKILVRHALMYDAAEAKKATKHSIRRYFKRRKPEDGPAVKELMRGQHTLTLPQYCKQC
jgi:hypothetical protein